MAQRINVIAFPGAPNLPVFAAQQLNIFAEAGIEIGFATTPSSIFQFERFAAGDFDVAFTAFDNVVAYREGQGAAKLDPIPDFRVAMGATQLGLSLVVAPGISSAADLEGKTLALDAVSTGFAFVLYDLLAHLGLPRDAYRAVAVGATPDRWQSVKAGIHAGTITIEPFTSIALSAGFRVLARSRDLFPDYQGGVIAVRKDWADSNRPALSKFLDGYRQGLRWVLAPQNRNATSDLLRSRMPEINPRALSAVMDSILSPETGLTPEGHILRDGMRTVLDLRSRYGEPQRQLHEIEKYLDLVSIE